MPSRKRDADELRALCADIHPDDGVDPRDDTSRDAMDKEKPDRKLQQLCKQVGQAVQLIVSNMPEDLHVASVQPAPNAGRLRVVLEVADTVDPRHMADILDRSRRFIRNEVATVVSRRRVPELVFAVVHGGGHL